MKRFRGLAVGAASAFLWVTIAAAQSATPSAASPRDVVPVTASNGPVQMEVRIFRSLGLPSQPGRQVFALSGAPINLTTFDAVTVAFEPAGSATTVSRQRCNVQFKSADGQVLTQISAVMSDNLTLAYLPKTLEGQKLSLILKCQGGDFSPLQFQSELLPLVNQNMDALELALASPQQPAKTAGASDVAATKGTPVQPVARPLPSPSRTNPPAATAAPPTSATAMAALAAAVSQSTATDLIEKRRTEEDLVGALTAAVSAIQRVKAEAPAVEFLMAAIRTRLDSMPEEDRLIKVLSAVALRGLGVSARDAVPILKDLARKASTARDQLSIDAAEAVNDIETPRSE